LSQRDHYCSQPLAFFQRRLIRAAKIFQDPDSRDADN